MSLEKSMETLAESNLKLAASFDRYAEVVERFGLKIEKDNEGRKTVAEQEDASGKTTTEKTPAAEKKAPGRPKKAPEPAPEPEGDGLDDDDDLGDEEEIAAPDGLDFDAVKKKLLDVKAANGGDKAPAIAIINEFGYNSITEVKPKHFDDVWIAAEKKIRELQA